MTQPHHIIAVNYFTALTFYFSNTYLLTNLLTPWCRVLLEKLTGLQLVKKFPAFRGTRRFITTLTSLRHLSLSWASPIQSVYPHPTSWRSILILSTHLRLGLPSGLLLSGFPTKTLYSPLSNTAINYGWLKALLKCNLVQALRLCTDRTAHRGVEL